MLKPLAQGILALFAHLDNPSTLKIAYPQSVLLAAYPQKACACFDKAQDLSSLRKGLSHGC